MNFKEDHRDPEKPTNETSKFYLIWSPQSTHAPSRRHEHFGMAKKEAKRLSKKYQGQEFFIVKSVGDPEKIDRPTCCKVTYQTKGEADEAASVLAKNKRVGNRGDLRAYECKHCQKFHLTSQLD